MQRLGSQIIGLTFSLSRTHLNIKLLCKTESIAGGLFSRWLTWRRRLLGRIFIDFQGTWWNPVKCMWEALGIMLGPEQKLNTSFLYLPPLHCSSQAPFSLLLTPQVTATVATVPFSCGVHWWGERLSERWWSLWRGPWLLCCVCAHVPKHTSALLIRRMAWTGMPTMTFKTAQWGWLTLTEWKPAAKADEMLISISSKKDLILNLRLM